MKLRNALLILTSATFVCGCTPNQSSSNNSNSSSNTSSGTSGTSQTDTGSSGTTSGSTKVTVAAHTLSDSNPPIDIFTPGQHVDKNTWNSFKNGSASKFANHYNFTYTAFYSASNYQMRFYTKDGYAFKTLTNDVYSRQFYERKSGNTYYQYVDVDDGVLRQVSTDSTIASKYTELYLSEIYVHMFEYEEYTYREDNEDFFYDGGTFTSVVQFQGGYLSYLFYQTSGITFTLNNSFNTTIEIPKSYYYQ